MKKITFAIPAEDVEYVESIRVYNVKISAARIVRELLILLKIKKEDL